MAHDWTQPVVAIGPEYPQIGSWEWIGVDMVHELSRHYRTIVFRDEIPPCDVLVVVKHKLPTEAVIRAAQHRAVIFCPVDGYGSSAEIDGDSAMLFHCSRIIIHCERLRKYFQSYAPVSALDHHLKYAAPIDKYRSSGHILWVGMQTNLRPVVDWANHNSLPEELWVLTNLPDATSTAEPDRFGFRREARVRIAKWNGDLQRAWTATARGAIDIKGQDFRQRHKPPTKAFDFIASGVPLAMNADSSPAQHLAQMGFTVAQPEDTDRWLSYEYWRETCRLGQSLQELLTRERIGLRFKDIIDEVLSERRRS